VFDTGGAADPEFQAADPEPALDAELAGMRSVLAGLEQRVSDGRRIDRLRRFAELEAALAAAKAREVAAFTASQRAAQAALGVPAERVGRGVAAQVGLALRISPAAAQRYVGWAVVLTRELPQTLAALRQGRVAPWRALLVARETLWLSREHRAQVDRELAPKLEMLGDRAVAAEARRIGYRLDPAGFVARTQAAAADRRVMLRPAPDTMVRLCALLPVPQGVAAYAALTRTADTTTAAGDPRGRAQIMADTLVQRLTGQSQPDAVPVEVTLVLSAQTLLGTSSEPGEIHGYGPLPAPTARALALHTDAPRWLRRLFTSPTSGQLIAMETTRRTFTPAQRHYLRLRDRTCRTPYCDAPIRHADHITPHHAGGPTTITNAQGYCQHCNHTKQAPGWTTTTTTTSHDGPHTVTTTTPTGHHYTSQAPDPPRAA
jgi:hypothetical protein